MEVKLAKGMREKIEETAHALGMNELEVINHAILFYLDSIEKNVQLRNEFQAWERLSDEAWGNLDKEWKREKSG